MASKVSNLSPFQAYLSQKYPTSKKVKNIDYAREAENFFLGAGGLDSKVPPGAQIIDRRSGYVKYRDAEGYDHELTIDSNGLTPNAGKVSENTNRPGGSSPEGPMLQNLLSQLNPVFSQQAQNAAAMARGETPAAYDPGIQGYLDSAQSISDRLKSMTGFSELDPATMQRLQEIDAAEKAALGDQFQKAQSTSIAQLFGNGVQQSSIAGEAMARLLQQQGLVSQQQQAGSAERELTTRAQLTQEERNRLQLALQGYVSEAQGKLGAFTASNQVNESNLAGLRSLLAQFTQQATARGINDANLAEQARQFNSDYEFKNSANDIAVRKANSNDLLKKLLATGASLGLSFLTGGAAALPGLGQLGGIFGGGSSNGDPGGADTVYE